MHIGLIGGIGPAATDVYYRGLIAHAAGVGRDLDLTIVHADAPTLLRNLAADDHEAQREIYDRLTGRLRGAGAACVAVTSIAGHFCIDRFAATSVLPVLDLTTALAEWLRTKGMKRVGVLGTGTVMSTGVYGKLAPIEVVAPPGDDLAAVHEAYVALATSGTSSTDLQDVFFRAGRALMDDGAEAVLLGGTDLNLAFSGAACGFPIVDCAKIHIDAIASHV